MPRKNPGRRAYATDLTNTQWALIASLIPEAEPGGRPRKASSRELVNAILYFLRAGMAWRLLPHDLPPWQTVYYYLRRWQREGVWDRVHHTLVMTDRERGGRAASPTAAILDSQSIRTADQKGASKGYDAGKKIKGRKRHILTDTDGRLLTIQVHGADIQDRDGAKGVLRGSRALFPFVELAYVDGGYAGRLVRWAKERTHIVLEVVKRSAKQAGFAVIRRRWVVERTFAWIVKNRRFVRDYEQLTAVAETLITIAATATLIRRWP
jgi:putative transposase